ncbi:MAG: hypothetical protein GXO26_00910 [Crenarchaeota archaeon]|nr:hypothetical protein [Thermoproteota archaeon]
MSKKASISKLNELHALIAEYYGETLKDAIEERAELSSGTLNAINGFLKQNEITADVVESQPLQNLQARVMGLLEKEREETV